MALIGHVDEISRSVVEGWVVDTDRPDEAMSVSIFVDGVHRGMCLTTHTRTDLVLPSGETLTGKCAFWFAFDPPLSPFISLRIDVIETWSAQPLANGSRVLPKPDAPDDGAAGRIPILLTSTGRTGTTLLMSEFVRHPDIVVGDHFPYEIKQIAYHAAAFRALAADADRERSTTPETMLASGMNRIIGSNPYNMTGLFGLGGPRGTLRDFYQSTVPSGFAKLFRSLILEFYATIANAQGKPSTRFFCEKSDIDDAAVQGARLFFNEVKDIIIVRDPRDLLCSAIAFWKLRPEIAMTMLTTTIPRLARIARHAGPNSIVIRYEDLVRDPVRTRLALSDFLDLDLLTHAEADAVPDSHRTSRDPAASIGRWRNDLAPEQVEACESAFAFFMREFDYEAGEHAARSGKGRRANQIVAAEGGLAVAALVANTIADDEDGVPSQLVLELNFGRQSSGESCILEGWSNPERGFVWSCAPESTVRLPALRQSGDHRLYITAAPFTHGDVLPAQRITVLLDGRQAGTARLRDISVLSIPLPSAVAESGQPVTVTLCFPDAARPATIAGGNDDRLLGFSLHRIAMSRIGTERREAILDADGRQHGTASDRGDPSVTARLETCFREAFRQPDIQYLARTRIDGLAGFDATSFVRLILAVETQFGISLHEDEVDSVRVMDDLVTLVHKKSG